MAESLIKTMSDGWQPEKYHDDYRGALLKLIEEKVAAGEKGVSAPKAKAKKSTKVIDLAEVLRQSLAQTHGVKEKKSAKGATAGKHQKAA